MSEPMRADDAEISLLGAAMSGYRDLDDILDILDADDFYHPFHADVWTAIGRVRHAGNTPDPVSVRLALTTAEVKHDPVRLLDFTSLCPLVANAPAYAEQVRTASGLRRITRAATKIAQLAEVPGELDEIRELARAAVDEATTGKSTTRARTLADILPSVIDTAQNGRANVIGTGWPDIDRLIGGLAPGRLVVVGARPGVGKSLLGTNLALHVARRFGHAALVASLEMPEDEVVQRMLAAHARVNLTNLIEGKVDERAWDQVAQRMGEFSAFPITVDDQPGQTVNHIRRKARDVQRTRDDLALIVVDYLQLVEPRDNRPNANRAEQLGQVSRDLKLLARETGACVVAMAQVNRESSKRNDAPRMSDLRESGSIEADADQVLLLHQPDENIPELEVLVDKNRHGPKGRATLKVYGHYALLASVEWSPTGRIA